MTLSDDASTPCYSAFLHHGAHFGQSSSQPLIAGNRPWPQTQRGCCRQGGQFHLTGRPVNAASSLSASGKQSNGVLVLCMQHVFLAPWRVTGRFHACPSFLQNKMGKKSCNSIEVTGCPTWMGLGLRTEIFVQQNPALSP